MNLKVLFLAFDVNEAIQAFAFIILVVAESAWLAYMVQKGFEILPGLVPFLEG